MQFKKVFSDQAANAPRISLKKDSGTSATDAKASFRDIAGWGICTIMLMSSSILFADVQSARAQQPSTATTQTQNPAQDPSTVATQAPTATPDPPDPTKSQGRAEGSPDLLKQSQNPIANLVSVPFQNDFYPLTGFHKEEAYDLEMKPVMPFSLSKDWLLIARPIIPIIQEPDLAPGVGGMTGLGDVELETFLSPTKAGPGHITWGAGTAFSFPTATENILGTKKFSVGPDLVVLKSQGHWMYGALAQNLWSVEGPRERPDVNQFLIQPFLFYNLPHKWYLVSSPIMTANWKIDTGRWTVPVGGGVGKIQHFGRMPVDISGQFFGDAEHPNGTSSWSARFQVKFLFPKR